jgi:hypothetical protein
MADLVTVIANVSLTLSFVVALVVGVLQFRAWGRDRKERLTLETLRFYQSREFAELSDYIISVQFPKNRDEFNALSHHDRILFIDFSQKMEAIGLLVSEGLIDIDLVDKTIGDFVITAWKKYKPILLEMREKIPDPYLAEYFQWLAMQMDKNLKDDHHRRPVYEAGQILPVK